MTEQSAGPTGDEQLDTALAGLDELAELPVAEHLDRYEAVHAALQDRLSNVDGR